MVFIYVYIYMYLYVCILVLCNIRYRRYRRCRRSQSITAKRSSSLSHARRKRERRRLLRCRWGSLKKERFKGKVWKRVCIISLVEVCVFQIDNFISWKNKSFPGFYVCNKVFTCVNVIFVYQYKFSFVEILLCFITVFIYSL